MKITVIGSGYVGLVSGICFAKIGHEVVCVDKDQSKIDRLKQDIVPIYEPGLKELLSEVLTAKRISFTTNLVDALKDSKAVFIAVGTPQGEDGSADMSYVFAVAKEIAQSSQEGRQSYSEKDHRTPEKESDGLSGEDCEKSRATRPNIELETRTW